MDNTKVVSITAREIKVLMRHYGSEIERHDEFAADENIERLRYLNKRLKDFNGDIKQLEKVQSSW